MHGNGGSCRDAFPAGIIRRHDAGRSIGSHRKIDFRRFPTSGPGILMTSSGSCEGLVGVGPRLCPSKPLFGDVAHHLPQMVPDIEANSIIIAVLSSGRGVPDGRWKPYSLCRLLLAVKPPCSAAMRRARLPDGHSRLGGSHPAAFPLFHFRPVIQQFFDIQGVDGDIEGLQPAILQALVIAVAADRLSLMTPITPASSKASRAA